MKNKILLFFLLTFSITAYGQLPDGSSSPDFTLDDLGGSSHNLYSYLDEGYSAVLDFSATWCGPCWNYHQTGILEDIWSDYGQGGDDLAMVFMIEADPGTTEPCIYGPAGCSGGSIGDWTAGVDYPILNPPASQAADVNSDFSINYFPTLYGVRPNGDIYEIGQAGFGTWEEFVLTNGMARSTYEVTDLDCEASEIDLEPVGGFGQIQYNWSNGSTNEDLFNVPNGIYYVTLSDELTGSRPWATEIVIGPIEIDNSTQFEVDLVEHVDVACYGDATGYLEVEPDGGSGDFSYEWSNGGTEAYAENLTEGDYDVLVIDNDTGCESEQSFYIEEQDEILVEYEVFDAECGDELGLIEFDIDGGAYPFLYDFGTFITDEEDISLEPGEYDVTITDFFGCEEFASFEIATSGGPMADTEAEGMFNCMNNPVFINADSSSVGNNIEYYWFDPSYIPVDTGYRARVDSVGTYTLEVRDLDNGCVTVEQVTVMEDFTTPVAQSAAQGFLTCNNTDLIISGEGSTTDTTVTYTWTTNDGSIVTDATELDIEIDAAGTYTLEVFNMYSGCSSISSVTVEEPQVPVAAIEGGADFCEGDEVEVCADNVTNDETIEWFVNNQYAGSRRCIMVDASATVELVLTNEQSECDDMAMVEVVELEAPTAQITGDNNVCDTETGTLCIDLENGERASWTINGQDAGGNACIDFTTSSDVNVTVTNANGCSKSDQVSTFVSRSPQVDIAPPATLDCNLRSTTVDATFDGNYSVQWFNQFGDVISTDESLEVSSAGTYMVVATNQDGCSTSETVTVEANEEELATADFASNSSEFTFDFEDMSQGEVTEYLWDFGDGNTSTMASPSHTYDDPGYYTVCLTVKNDCGESTSCEEVLAYSAMQISTDVVNVTCNGDNDGSIRVNVFGGLPNYMFAWDGPTTGLTGDDVGDLAPGTYEVIITDATGAEITETYTITEPDPMVVSGDVVNTPQGQSVGSIDLSIDGGNGNYTVSWDNGMSGMMITGLDRGMYTATIMDSEGCTTTETFAVTGTTNVSEIEFITNFVVAPNPASDFVNVTVESSQRENIQLNVIDMNGRSLINRSFNSNFSESIDLSQMASGVYLIELRSGKKLAMKKLVVTQ